MWGSWTLALILATATPAPPPEPVEALEQPEPGARTTSSAALGAVCGGAALAGAVGACGVLVATGATGVALAVGLAVAGGTPPETILMQSVRTGSIAGITVSALASGVAALASPVIAAFSAVLASRWLAGERVSWRPLALALAIPTIVGTGLGVLLAVAIALLGTLLVAELAAWSTLIDIPDDPGATRAAAQSVLVGGVVLTFLAALLAPVAGLIAGQAVGALLAALGGVQADSSGQPPRE